MRSKEKFSLGEKPKILFSNRFQDTLIHTIQLYLWQEKIPIRMRQASAIDHETAPRSDEQNLRKTIIFSINNKNQGKSSLRQNIRVRNHNFFSYIYQIIADEKVLNNNMTYEKYLEKFRLLSARTKTFCTPCKFNDDC